MNHLTCKKADSVNSTKKMLNSKIDFVENESHYRKNGHCFFSIFMNKKQIHLFGWFSMTNANAYESSLKLYTIWSIKENYILWFFLSFLSLARSLLPHLCFKRTNQIVIAAVRHCEKKPLTKMVIIIHLIFVAFRWMFAFPMETRKTKTNSINQISQKSSDNRFTKLHLYLNR